MARLTPWIIPLVVTVVAAIGWLRPIGEPSHGASDAPAAVTPTTAAQPRAAALEGAPPAPTTALRATRECLKTLERSEAARLRCSRRARQLSSPPSAAAAPAGLEGEEFEQAVERRIDEAIRDHLERERDRSMAARARERAAFDEWSREALRLEEDEREWLTDYVCTVRELRERTLASLDETPPAEALELLKKQRKQVLKDLEGSLGPERYATLRAIGGLGLLADTTDCG